MSLTSYRAAPPRVGVVWAFVCCFGSPIGDRGKGMLEDLAATYSPVS